MHRINSLAAYILIIGAGLIQATAFDYISISGIKPDLLLAVVVFFSLFCIRSDAVRAAIGAGIIKDITSSSILGGYTVSFLLIALFFNYHQRKFYKERGAVQILVTSSCYFFMSLLVLFFNVISGKAAVIHYPFFDIVVKGAVYTGLVSPPVFFALSKILRVPLAPNP